MAVSPSLLCLSSPDFSSKAQLPLAACATEGLTEPDPLLCIPSQQLDKIVALNGQNTYFSFFPIDAKV